MIQSQNYLVLHLHKVLTLEDWSRDVFLLPHTGGGNLDMDNCFSTRVALRVALGAAIWMTLIAASIDHGGWIFLP